MKSSRIWAIILLLVFVLSVIGLSRARAQDTGLQRLETWGLGRGWEGVGLLNIEGRRTCTGVLIAPDLVLTAAHCLYNVDGARMADPKQVEFRAGWRNGKAIARRYGRVSLIHPDFPKSPNQSTLQIRNDVALLQLAAPILSTHADPFRTDGGARRGDKVSVVSFGSGRNDVASRQKSCQILEAGNGVVAMSCDVVAGSSGSPVFAMRDGRPRVVSLVSSLGEWQGQAVSFGMDIRAPVARIMADFRAGIGVYPKPSFGVRRLGIGEGRELAGARFVRP